MDTCCPTDKQTLRSLSSAQRAFWDKHPDDSGAAGVIVGLSLDIFAPVETGLFRAALQAVADQSDTFRTAFTRVDGQLVQAVTSDVAVVLAVLDLSASDTPSHAHTAAVDAWSNTPFDLRVAPLIDHLLVRLSAEHWTWHCRAHHLIMDAAAAAIGIPAILDSYARLAAGGAPDLSHLGSYEHFLEADAAYVASDRHAEDLAYWVDRHATAPEPLFRAGQGLPAQLPPRQHEVSRPQYDALVAACRDEDIQPLHAFIAALGALAFRRFGRTSITLGLATHNRSTDLDRRTIGLFAGTMAFRLAFHPAESMADIARRASRQLRRDYRHARLPLDQLARALGQSAAPLYDLALSFYPAAQDMQVSGARVRLRTGIFAGLDTEPVAIHIRDPQGDANGDSPLGVDLTHRPDLVSSSDAVGLYDAFVQLLGHWPTVRHTPISELAS